ncbi:hypothetical protein PF005_g24352 [Phytophthora fragariae]|uniref:Uncharacterized protein n=1 Tax=Phytophthora fragariae TaxID=53985 RepID=A0A6A3DXI9_9STRA|nr:hypothetical protein PF003_g34523 [Phytophthora fragariae]KAE8924657.1 hypothetical protein PF009_g25113 [Phytophthora fragariae]KAE8978102.1 hypothetical protein PF011_g23387 [Phytophthora fragariae]KAE9076271.1 hypothetical protein PF010_g23966 [Phytophthora fragariae]KAE9077052.1 hypothetical protein PF007_g24393 [Phytophthora fragariae]
MANPSHSPSPSRASEAPYASIADAPAPRGVDQRSMSQWVVPRAAVFVAGETKEGHFQGFAQRAISQK